MVESDPDLSFQGSHLISCFTCVVDLAYKSLKCMPIAMNARYYLTKKGIV